MKCRHCDHRMVGKRFRGRGLCDTCGDKPAVRALYPTPEKPPPSNPCRHCRVCAGQRGKRGLCVACHRDPAVRALYPVEARASERPALCVNCGRRPPNRPRGLCWNCYYRPGVKELFPSTSKYARCGVGNGTGERPPAPHPCPHDPGSAGRIKTLEARAKARVQLWHPGDKRFPLTRPDLT